VAALRHGSNDALLEFIEQHLVEDISLDALAKVVRLSPYHFLRSSNAVPWRATTSLTGRRGGSSARRLFWQIPRASITEVAFQVGFSGTSAFSAAFRRVAGQTRELITASASNSANAQAVELISTRAHGRAELGENLGEATGCRGSHWAAITGRDFGVGHRRIGQNRNAADADTETGEAAHWMPLRLGLVWPRAC